MTSNARINGRAIGPIGFGMGSLAHPGHVLPVDKAIEILKAALDAGANFWNAGDIYGTPDWNSLHILKAYFTKYPEDTDKVVISVKSCFDMRAGKAAVDAAGVRAAIEKCLDILQDKCRIDIFEPARLDRAVPVEETMGAIAEFVRSGRIGAAGLSECSAESIRRAVKVTPVAAVELEVSLLERSIWHNGVAEACAQSGIPIIAYSPLSHGFLTGKLRRVEDVPQGDFRHLFPRFGPEAFNENLKVVDAIEHIAQQKGCTISQVAIAWLQARGKALGTPIVPIPGSSMLSRISENTRLFELSQSEEKDIEQVLERIEVKGDRAPPRFAHFLEV